MTDTGLRPRVLIFIVAYNAEKTIEKVLKRIPDSLMQYDTEILIIDDASKDSTFEAAEMARLKGITPYRVTVLRNPVNQMYGGNQKIGYHYAVENGFDVVALVHGDGQYAPEELPRLLAPLVSGECDVVQASRMMTMTGALKGGMPLYKYVGNRVLTGYQNIVLGSKLSEFHTGYKLYSTKALKRIPFHLNTNDFHFDTEIIIQLILSGARIKEMPIPTYYGDEVCHVNGLKYAFDVFKASTTARLQRYCLMYRRNFDVQPPETDSWRHMPKLAFKSSQTEVLSLIEPGTSVLAFGGDSATDLIPLLEKKGCRVTVLDRNPAKEPQSSISFLRHDPDVDETMPVDATEHDYVLMLDVLEHARYPERFLESLKEALTFNQHARLIVVTANIGFFIPRLMHLAGQFNYSKKGVLDLGHTRLFTFVSLKRLLEESGFIYLEERGIPAPYPLVIKNSGIASWLLNFNESLIKLSKGLFSYQMLMVAKPRPTLPALLKDAQEHSRIRLSSADIVPGEARQSEPVGSAR